MHSTQNVPAPKSQDSSFGQRLRSLRKQAGLTREQLASRIQVSIKTIQRWEADIRIPRVDEIERLAIVLNVDRSALLNNEDDNQKQWVLSVLVQLDHQKEVINVAKPQATIITRKDGGFLELGGSYDLWTDNDNFKRLIADLKKLRATVIQNGKALGGIKE